VDLTEIRRQLEAKLDKLSRRVAHIGSNLRRPGDPDSQEQATEMENDEVLERLEVAERREIEAIRNALSRIEAGTYTECARCGEDIPEGRLRAVPETNVCAGCAS
jgi:DnaK suppressor protein